jgi:hypothetical protein
MGMYDELNCEAKLPDRDVLVDTSFQTKSFPWPCFQHYRITTAGRLVNKAGRDLEPTGYIHFYRLDEASDGLVEYRARFVDGQLQSIVRIRDADDFIYGLESIRWFRPEK